MIQSTQKVIKIGSSVGVTIPKKQLESMGKQVGDMVQITVDEPQTKLGDLAKRLDKFTTDYDQDLKNLAKR